MSWPDDFTWVEKETTLGARNLNKLNEAIRTLFDTAAVPGPPGPAGPTGATGPQGPQGAAGTGINMKGQVATVAALPPTGNVQGDAYTVIADGNLYVWNGTTWINTGPMQGPPGPAGATGATGPAGATGSQGPPGTPGSTGATGAPGAAGPAGPGIAVGGTPGQFLIKNTATNYDTAWLSPNASELDYVTLAADTAAISATTEAAAVTILTGNSVAYDGSRVKVEAQVNFVTGTGTVAITLVFLRDTTVIGQAKYLVNQIGGGNANMPGYLPASVFDTPSAGAHTYSVKAFVASSNFTAKAGAGGSGNLVPTYLRVSHATLVGPQGPAGPAGPAGSPAAGAIDVQTFVANGTWTKPATATMVQVITIGQGGGGGGGGSSGAARAGGGGGGGGARLDKQMRAADLPGSVPVTVSSASNKGLGSTTTTGGAGGTGGASSFGSYVVAGGGGWGAGGLNAGGANGGGGGSAYASAVGVAASGGGVRKAGLMGGNGIQESAEWGGAGGGRSWPDNPAEQGGGSVYGGNGGGGGSGAGVGTTGGATGGATGQLKGGGGTAGVQGASPTAGGNGASANGTELCGAGGGGGGNPTGTGPGMNGGNGGFPGGGGGGGGTGTTTGQLGGNGGDGGGGLVVVFSW